MDTQALEMFNNTVKFSENDIFVQPLCEFFKIDFNYQKKSINNNPLLKSSTSKKTSMLLFGDKKERFCLSKEGFITWVIQLRCEIVHPSLQEKLILYQSLIFQYFFSSIEREQNIKLKYARLKKLKRLSSKINSEIKICQEAIEDYLSNKFSQTKLDFKETKKLN